MKPLSRTGPVASRREETPRANAPPHWQDRRVAVLVGTSTGWGREVIRGIRRYAAVHGNWTLHFGPVGLDEIVSIPKAWKGDGVIARISCPAILRSIRNTGLPCVNVSSIAVPHVDQYPRVGIDHVQSAREAFQYFYANGFRSFGFFSLTNPTYLHNHVEEFLTQARAKKCCAMFYCAQPDSSDEAGWAFNYKKVGQWLKRLPKPCAILAWNASACQWVMHSAQAAGLKIPDEIAVMSTCDDDFMCPSFHIPISAIQLPAEENGFKAAEYLDQMMKGRTFPRGTSELLAPHGVVTRQSTDTLAISDHAVIKALTYLREHCCHGDLTLSAVVKASGVSRRSLERRFTAVVGRTLHAQLTFNRLAQAKRLLVETDLNMDVIAWRSGFDNDVSFFRVFKQATGMTPKKYRAENVS